MTVDKRINYNVQGNVKNYLGKQKIVKAPLHWQSAPNHPTTELAYITKKEKDLLIKKDLHKSLKGGVNRGPSGIMSLNGWGDAPTGGKGPRGSSGGGYGETGKSFGDQERRVTVTTGSPRGDQTATRTVSPKDTFAQSWSGQPGFLGFGGGYRNLKTPGDTSGGYQSRLGGMLGAVGKGALGLVGGIPGKLMSGIMTAKDWAKRKGTGAWEGIQEFGEYDTLQDYFNRNKTQAIQPVETIDIRDKFDRRGNNNLGADTQVIEEEQNFNPNFLALGAKEGGRIGFNKGGNYAQNEVAGQLFGTSFNVLDPFQQGQVNDAISAYGTTSIGTLKAQGGRIGLRIGGAPEDYPESENENMFDFMQDQGIPFGPMAEGEEDPLSMLIAQYIEQGFSPAEAERMAIEELQARTSGQDEGLASLI